MRCLVAIALLLVPACTIFVSTDDLAGSRAPTPPDAEPDAPQDTPDAASESDAPQASPDASLSPYESFILSEGPLAYWRMGITTGRIVPDRTGRGNDLVLQGTGHKLVPGAIAGDADGAIEFDGVSSRAIATNARDFDFEGRHPFTIECWFQRRPLASSSEYQYLVNSSVGSGEGRTGYTIWITPPEGGNPQPQGGFEWLSAGGDVESKMPLPPANVFVHYAAVFDGNAVILYMDGDTSGSTPVVSTAEQTARATDFVIGGDYDGSECLSGVIDEVAIYGRALSPSEVARHYNAGHGL